MLISDGYRQLNAELHESNTGYGTSGAKWGMHVNRLALDIGAKTILDYGCGKGTLKEKLGRIVFTGLDGPRACPYEILEYDPAVPGKDEHVAVADLVVCGDVLEHIEPDCLYSVLDDIARIAKKAVFFVVATEAAQKILSDGRNAHLIIEKSEWWLPKLAARWHLRDFRDLGGEFLMIGTAK